MDSDMNMSMPVMPAYGNGNNGFGFGGDWAWILLLLVLFGNGNGFGWGGGMDGLYPWMNNSQNINNGFRDQMMYGQLGDIQTTLNANAMAAMQQANAMQAQFANCCCENRLATANLAATIASEACADRAAVNDGVRDILTNQNANTQRILDQMCADKLDAKNDEIAQLRAQINALNLAASQQAQTAAIIANNEAQTTALERYLAPSPMPAYVVANPNCCCQNYSACGVAA